MIRRRGFIFGLGATLAVIPAARLMRVAVLRETLAPKMLYDWCDLLDAGLFANFPGFLYRATDAH